MGSVHYFDAILAAIAQDPDGIGYAGFGNENENVKTVALAEKDEGPYWKGTFDDVASYRYPLCRFLYVFVDRPPGKPLDGTVEEFLRFVLSKEGQAAVQEEGVFLPLSAAIAKQERAKLE